MVKVALLLLASAFLVQQCLCAQQIHGTFHVHVLELVKICVRQANKLTIPAPFLGKTKTEDRDGFMESGSKKVLCDLNCLIFGCCRS